MIKKSVDRLFNPLDEIDFKDTHNDDTPVVYQIEVFAEANGIELEKGWKVGISVAEKVQLKNKKAEAIPPEYIDK